jgi:hypothetical protein
MIPVFNPAAMKVTIGLSAVAIAGATYAETPAKPEDAHPPENIFALHSNEVSSSVFTFFLGAPVSVTPGLTAYTAEPGAVIEIIKLEGRVAG